MISPLRTTRTRTFAALLTVRASGVARCGTAPAASVAVPWMKGSSSAPRRSYCAVSACSKGPTGSSRHPLRGEHFRSDRRVSGQLKDGIVQAVSSTGLHDITEAGSILIEECLRGQEVIATMLSCRSACLLLWRKARNGGTRSSDVSAAPFGGGSRLCVSISHLISEASDPRSESSRLHRTPR
jgi:hypothetical protein